MNFEDYESLPTESLVVHMTAGAIAGMMEHCIMYPLDSVKTRMQSLRSAHNGSIGETLRYMVQREGLLRPVRGMSAVVAGAGPAHACYFATYEHCKHTLGNITRHKHDHFTHGLSGCVASLVHDAVSNPAEVVKQRVQMLGSPYRGVWECARHVYRTEGARAFYRSYSTQIVMNVPFQAVHFATYEWATSRLNPCRQYDPVSHAVAGAAAGALAAAATTPLDVCKTQLNTQECTPASSAGTGGAGSVGRRLPLAGLPDAARLVLRTAGPAGFLRGLQPRILYQMPAAAICWLTYETLKHLLRAQDPAPAPAPPGPPPSPGPPAPSPGPAVPSPAPLACAALRLAAADVTRT